MDIFYTNETLYVDIKKQVTKSFVNEMKRNVFKIILEYEINNVEIFSKANSLKTLDNLKQFETEYYENCKGGLKII